MTAFREPGVGLSFGQGRIESHSMRIVISGGYPLILGPRRARHEPATSQMRTVTVPARKRAP